MLDKPPERVSPGPLIINSAAIDPYLKPDQATRAEKGLLMPPSCQTSPWGWFGHSVLLGFCKRRVALDQSSTLSFKNVETMSADLTISLRAVEISVSASSMECERLAYSASGLYILSASTLQAQVSKEEGEEAGSCYPR